MLRVFAKINHEVLKWARETRGIPLAPAAKAIGIDEAKLMQCEQGKDKLSIPQLRSAAEKYRRPLAVFYLPNLPPGEPLLPDFRRLPDIQGQPLSPARCRAAPRRDNSPFGPHPCYVGGEHIAGDVFQRGTGTELPE